MGIVEAITADHAEAAALFAELAPVASDDRRSGEVMRLAARLAITVKTAAMAEQRVLYALLATAREPLGAFARQAPHEFHALDVMLDKLLALRPGPDLAAVVAVAQRLFDSIRARQIAELLPAICSALTEVEGAQLARDHVAEKRRIRPRIERLIVV